MVDRATGGYFWIGQAAGQEGPVIGEDINREVLGEWGGCHAAEEKIFRMAKGLAGRDEIESVQAIAEQ